MVGAKPSGFMGANEVTPNMVVAKSKGILPNNALNCQVRGGIIVIFPDSFVVSLIDFIVFGFLWSEYSGSDDR